MKRTFCDRCAKEIPEDEVRKVTIQEGSHTRVFELCPACKNLVLKATEVANGEN